MQTLRLVSIVMIAGVAGLSSSSSRSEPSRREWLNQAILGVFVAAPVVTRTAQIASAADELPSFLRPYTKLAPLGGKGNADADKTRNLPLEEIASRLSKDLEVGARGRGGYFLTGDLSTDLFRDDCLFVDPTNSVSSTSQYQKALRILFDPDNSKIELVRPLAINSEERTISGRIRSRGVLKLPWHPRISTYESDIVYKIDEDGLVKEQSQTWTKSANKALAESFTPDLFGSPPMCTLEAAPNEPRDVTQLVTYVNGRRPAEYSQEERFEISKLIDVIVDAKYEWKPSLLPGKWILAYLQPGPEGGGVDRRIPFPEFDFNDSYQIFSESSVTNVGQVIGPLVQVTVSGVLRAQNDSMQVPKRFVANIDSGNICWKDSSLCATLPISGEGIFDGVYLGERLRIGQNINGGGARVVQVRVDE